ncbi:MAG: 3-deoxy-manno-octulosonate cytidylyltransferase [Alphaproteobacteria bacterium GM7ARS4]|nr:3-deoxy-manno-octulosonate cytidylyltransferase [Alphaproteobacteria bacterium GM7ARS4]
MAHSSLIVIPARLDSTRLKHKIMQDINGAPMLAHVIRHAQKAQIADVIVACDHHDTAQLCQTCHVNAIMTDSSLPSGSDRIAQALTLFDKEKTYQWIINVQGDMPSLTTQALSALNAMRPKKTETPTKEHMSIATLVAPIHDTEECHNPHVVKAIVSWDHQQEQRALPRGRAHYFTRRPVMSSDGIVYHHIGLYAYSRETLEAFQKMPPSPLESIEKLEQLRAIEADIPIYVSCLKEALRGIDTQEDLDAMRQQETQHAMP